MTVKKEYIHYGIALVLGVALALFLQPTNGLTNLGVRAIAVIIPTLYLWLTVNTHWTCFLILGLMVMTQAMTANEVWANSFGHFVFITVLAYSIFNVCLVETGVISKIAKFFITRKVVEGKPYVFMGMFFFSHLLVCFFADNVSLAPIYITIAEEIANNLKIKKGHPMYTALMLGILWTNALGQICSPIAHATPNLIMGLLQSACGITITYGSWMAFGAIYALLVFIASMIIMRIWNPDCAAFKNFDLEEMKKTDKPLDKRGKWTAIVFAISIMFVFVPAILAKVAPVFAYLNSLGVVVPALIGIVVLCLLQIDGKPALDFPTTINKVNFAPCLFAGTVASLAVPVSAANTGITEWLGNTLKPMLGGFSSLLIVVILIVLALLMTNFLSNTVTVALFFSIGAVVLASTDFNMAVFALVIGMASGMSTITPSASVPSPCFFAPGHLTMKDSLKPNLAFAIMTFVIITVIGIPLAGMLV